MKTILMALAALALVPLHALAHEAHSKDAAKPAEGQPQSAPLAKPKRDPQAYFTDTELVTQDGKRVRFYSDVLKGRLVLFNTIYTNCKDACPLILAQLVKVKDRLGDSFGKEVFFVTISSDPARDSPQAMKKYAQKHKADVPGWIHLTGKKENVELVLKRLGQFSQEVESHSTQLIAWNFNTDRGKKMLPNVDPEYIAAQLQLLLSPDPLAFPTGPGIPPPTPDAGSPPRQ